MSAASFKSMVYDLDQLDQNGNKIPKPKPFVRNDRRLKDFKGVPKDVPLHK
jgi:hypothetical protein